MISRYGIADGIFHPGAVKIWAERKMSSACLQETANHLWEKAQRKLGELKKKITSAIEAGISLPKIKQPNTDYEENLLSAANGIVGRDY
jgi:hypothetical protein